MADNGRTPTPRSRARRIAQHTISSITAVGSAVGAGYIGARSGLPADQVGSLALNVGAFLTGALNFGAVEDLPRTRYGQAATVAAGGTSAAVGTLQTQLADAPAAVFAVASFTLGEFVGKGARRAAAAVATRVTQQPPDKPGPRKTLR